METLNGTHVPDPHFSLFHESDFKMPQEEGRKRHHETFSEFDTNSTKKTKVGPGGDPSPSHGDNMQLPDPHQEDVVASPHLSSSSSLLPPPSLMESTMKDAANSLHTECLKWTKSFMESEKFEQICPRKVDELLEEAKALEKKLLHQKERLMQRLKMLSTTLQEM